MSHLPSVWPYARPVALALLSAALTAAVARPALAQQASPAPPAWDPSPGDGTYRNPVLHSDFSDPDAVRVGDDYYLTSSSFNCVPGLPILHSTDLVHWRLVNHALPKLYDPMFDRPQHGNGVWAPSIRFHDGWYYIYWGDPDLGIYMTRTRDPRGAWEEPRLVKKASGNIDPCPLWDDDGRVYMVQAFAHSRAGINGILSVVELSADGTKAIDKGWVVFDGHREHPTVEGPKFYKRNGYYYIFAPAGGVAEGWQLVLRSRNVRGPYETRTVLAQGDTSVNGPHQGAWVDTPDGRSWFLHFQEVQPYGRLVHLEPMRWVDDWPVIGEDPDGDGVGQPVATHPLPFADSASTVVPQTSDRFDSDSLGLQWQWQGAPRDDWWSLSERPGWLRLAAAARPDGFRNLWDAASPLLQKMPAPRFQATCRLDASALTPGDHCGLIVMGRDYASIDIGASDDGLTVSQRTCRADRGERERESESATLPGGQVELRLQVEDGGVCRFSYRTPGAEWSDLGGPFSAREGKWIGAKFGLYCLAPNGEPSGGAVDVAEVVVRPL